MSDKQILKSYDDLPTVNLSGIEIFAEGSWNGDKYSGDDLQAIVDAFDKVGFEPTVKAGHADGQDNLNEKEYRKVFGAPALGYVERVYRKGAKLVADLKQVPRHFANLIKAGSYKRVSSEIYWNYSDEASGKKFPRVLKSIAFLGAEIPALPNLKAIEALFHKTGGRVFAYDRGQEFRMYEMERRDYHGDNHDQEDHGNWADGESDGTIFSGDKADSIAKQFKSKLDFPYVDIYASTLGGKDRASIMIAVSLDDKSTWNNGIMENSRHAKLRLDRDGTLELLTRHGVDKMRKSKVKSLDAAVKKINAMRKYDLSAEAFEYAMKEMPEDMTVAEKDGKWCVYKGGAKVKEFGSQGEAEAYCNKMKGKYQDSKGEVHMTEPEVQAKLDALKAELAKNYEDQTAAAVAKAKEEAEIEKKALAERVAHLEKQNQEAFEAARHGKIDSRVEEIFKAGKLTVPEKDVLKSLARALPEAATHKYSADGKEIVEPVVESILKLFESRKVSLFSEISKQGSEIKTYSDAQAEVIRRANEAIAKSEGKLDMVKAYAQVAKEDPELWRKYQLDVKGAN